MSSNGAIMRAKSRFPAGVVAKPPAEYHRAAARACRSRRSARPTPMRRAAGFVERLAGRSMIPRRAPPTSPIATRMVGVGRGLSPDTGTGGELYAVIGHAPRHLDRNIARRRADRVRASSICARCRAGPRRWAFTRSARRTCRSSRARLASDLPAAERPRFEYLAGAVVRRLSARTKEPAGRFLHSSCRRGRSVQRQRAGAAPFRPARRPRPAAVATRLRCWMIDRRRCDGACWPRPAARAVVQKAHSADMRPISHWVRPQPGQ